MGRYILNNKSTGQWKSRRLQYNLILVASGILCLICMKKLNNTSVNFFMLPFLVMYLVVSNVFYTFVFRKFSRTKPDESDEKREQAYGELIMPAVILNIVLVTMLVLVVPHR